MIGEVSFFLRYTEVWAPIFILQQSRKL